VIVTRLEKVKKTIPEMPGAEGVYKDNCKSRVPVEVE